MIKRNGTFITILFAISCAIVVLPIISIPVSYIPLFSKIISQEMTPQRESFLNYITQLSTLALPLFLSIIVYRQSERINELEATQFDTFIGIEGLDYSCTIPDRLFVDSKNSTLDIAHMFTSTEKNMLIAVNLGEGVGIPIFLPLVFLTKNKPLIVSTTPKSLKIELLHKGQTEKSQEFDCGGEGIHAILNDGCRFIIDIGMIVPKRAEFDEIKLSLLINVKDQNGIENEFAINADLFRSTSDGKFYLASSQSLCLTERIKKRRRCA